MHSFFPVHSYHSLFQCTLFGALFETHVGLCALLLFGALFLFSSPTDQSYLNWLVSFGQNYFNRNLPRRNSLMSAHLCLPRQLPCSFPVEIVELPLTPPHAWYVHANNRGKLISPTWNLFIKLSQFMVCQGNRLTGRGRMKTQGRRHFIDMICTKSCYCQCLQLSPFLLFFCITKNYAPWQCCYENKVLWYLHTVLTYQSHVTPIVTHHRYL